MIEKRMIGIVYCEAKLKVRFYLIYNNFEIFYFLFVDDNIPITHMNDTVKFCECVNCL